ncbi:amine oxidase catalytic domain-containing protein [Zopfia rhizophila CBS 207.26]|uniref:Amine oxidase n=1 Tax=Zopfia rhizophila CBS 207.26 TaxID=1314779 RepID=A0A6A6EJ76_9PEZI|nr:amine oxidase catalytic domain-containing protein [Zopfia rhizophila CBS 207.26]
MDQPEITAPRKNIWLALSATEVEGVSMLLHHRFNLTGDDTIIQIELLQPNKTDALPFLANNNGTPPSRYARATLLFASSEDPYYRDYMIGPLPATNITKIQPLTYMFNNKTPGKVNVPAPYIGQDLLNFVLRIGSEVKDITQELWNASTEDGSVLPRLTSPFWKEEGKLIAWAGFIGAPTTPFDSTYLLPLGLFVRFDLTDRNSSKWSVTGWFYNGIFYENTDEFRDAVFSNGFEKLPPNLDGDWTSTDRQGEAMPLDELPPPVPVLEGTKRFSVDVKENYISWMDFTFYISVARDTGLTLYDVRFKGKRIIYELGLQESLTHYAGNDPVQSGTTYFDTQGGLGATMISLVNGFDCPSYSTYLNATWSDGEAVNSVLNGICLFEMDAGFPIQRHTASQRNYTSVSKNIVFTVRYVSTIGNYDFLFSYNFFIDGAIEVSVRASGYINAAYFAGDEEYGFKIHDFLSGSMHDHVLTFKADFDILGEKNSVQKVEFVPDTIEYPWAKGRPRNTMKVVRSFIENEAKAKINWDPNDAGNYAIVNKDSPNKFGEFPGYRVKRSAGAVHLTVKDSSNAVNAGNYAKNDLSITKQKDTEVRAADRYNGFTPEDPLIDFSKFFNDESLDQEDLVVWFNLGMHHIPHTGDLPNTVYSSAHSAIRMEPLNYLESDASRATKQQIRINTGNGNGTGTVVERFGAETANCSVDLRGLLGEF